MDVELDGGWADDVNPRIDLITYRFGPIPTVRVVHGTATPNADLHNRLGMPRLPVGETLIERVFVEQASGWHSHKLRLAPALVFSTAGRLPLEERCVSRT